MTLDDDIRADEPKTISKWSFEALVFGVIILITGAEVIAWGTVSRAFGFRRDGGLIGGLVLPNLLLARFAVDRALRRYGLSRSGKTFEVCGKAALEPEGEVDDDETVEVPLSEPNRRILLWGAPLLCVFFLATSTFVFDREPWMRSLGYLMGAFFGLATLNLLCDRKPQAWADRDGITGYPNGRSLRRRFVPWSDVATCEIETYFDTFGKPSIIQTTLRGWDGESFLKLRLLYTKIEDQERLVKYIKAKLPKPKIDFLE